MKYKIGIAIKNIRDRKGISQLELSSLAEVPQSTIAGIEIGRSKPGVDILFKLSQAMGLTPNDIFEEAGLLEDDGLIKEKKNNYGDPLIEKINLYATSLDERGRLLLLGIAEMIFKDQCKGNEN